MKIELIKYEDQFQIGITFTRHYHQIDENNKQLYHYHMFIDLGTYCLETTIGEKI
jgi:hypothetical protein